MTKPLMVWDSGFESWEYYQVTGQPQIVLVDSTGNELGRWGSLSPEIDELIGA